MRAELAITRWPSLNAEHVGKVERVPWPEFCKEMQRPQRFRGKWKHPGWSPGVFEPPRRAGENVRELHALGLDYDDSGAEIVEALECWAPWDGIVTTTKSHDDLAHRFRVVLRFSRPVTAGEYQTLWRWAVARARAWGHTIDPQTCDRGRRTAARASAAWDEKDAGNEPGDGSVGAWFERLVEPIDPAPLITMRDLTVHDGAIWAITLGEIRRWPRGTAGGTAGSSTRGTAGRRDNASCSPRPRRRSRWTSTARAARTRRLWLGRT